MASLRPYSILIEATVRYKANPGRWPEKRDRQEWVGICLSAHRIERRKAVLKIRISGSSKAIATI
jgi:hypothetical protein